MIQQVFRGFVVVLFAVASSLAADNVIISEFMAKNQTGIVDDNGSHEDWIEIFNGGTNTVDLFNWALTDSSSDLTKWRFPATNIGPGRFMIIWASGNNKRTAGAPLHTSFKLDPAPGEYLALVRPDGSIASEFAPTYPPQAQDISYGFALSALTNSFVAAGAAGRYLVPQDISQDLTWTDPGYADGTWTSGTTGLGYGFAANLAATDIRAAMSNVNSSVYLRVPFNVADASIISSLYLKMRYNDGFVAYLNGHEIARKNAPSMATGGEIANSTNDWSVSGAQGNNGWYYGYYDRSADTNDNTYTYTADFNMGDDHWAFGTAWTLGPDDPPYTMIGRTNWMPNGAVANFSTHWPVRRWVSPVSGVVTAQVSFAKAAGSTTGSGATLRVMLNGTTLTSRTISAADTTGFTTNIPVTGLDIGDVLDFALDPTGTDGQASETGDLCTFIAKIQQASSGDPIWNSSATGPAAATQATVGETIDVTFYENFLESGANVLAIQGLSLSPNDSDFLLLPELFGVVESVNTNQPVYFISPTPGTPNGLGRTNLGPLILDVAHVPLEPMSNQVVTVTARAAQTFKPVAGLTLRYRVMYGAEVSTPMFDDGQHSDGAAGDGVFGATIPASIAKQGEMIRYYIVSTDSVGVTNRSPSYLNTATTPQYWGLVVRDLSITSALPVMHWFIQSSDITTLNGSENLVRSSFYYKGQFFDNVGNTRHGQSSSGFGTSKKSYNFNLNSGYKLDVNPSGQGVEPEDVGHDAPKMSDFALITTWADRSHMRIPLNTESYKKAGVPANFAFMLRVQQNGSFFGVMNFMEQGNSEYLQRVGLDPDGALYKMYNTFTGVAGNEKKTRKYEPAFDLQAFYNAVTQGDTTAKLTWIYDNVNIPNMIDFLAAKSVTSDHDCCHKNYYFYRDSNNSGEWYALPWDFDLSWGHVWTSAANYFDDTINTNLFLTVGDNNTMFALLKADTALRSMWMRRTRTLADELLQPPGTTATNDMFRNRIDYLANLVRNDATLDKIKWGGQGWAAASSGPANPNNTNPTNNFETELARLKDYYLPGRRTFINLPSTISSYNLPATQTNPVILVKSVDYNPASANQAQEYVELFNTNSYPVDVSGWKLKGAIDFTLAGGTIIYSNTAIYVSPDVKAFRARTTGPRGGQRLMVVGPYKGQLSARGETVTLVNAAGITNNSLSYTGAPSLPQQYLRITEIMYHPAPAASGPYTADDFEYIELKNISTNVTISLNGVKFADGVSFNFTGSAITSLAPGQRCLVVASNAAFVSRYGTSLPVAGSYTGSLDNSGERIRLLDASNEEILDFSYNNSWYPITDGLGFSLVILDELGEPDSWDAKASWRPSGHVSGSPAAEDPPRVVVAPVLVNEVLTHTVLPEVDAVELFNPNTNAVDISGWFITDNFNVPAKYRISNGTVIPAGGFVVVTENQFNPAGTNFAFSSMGDEVYVFSGDASTNLTGYYDGFSFGAGDVGVSFARYVNSETNEFIVSQRTTTLGASNSGPRVGPIVVSEIMYAPVEGPDFEFIELLNISSNAVALYDPAFPTNRWKLKDAVSFSFSTNTAVAPGGYLLVVSFDPQTNATALAAFRAKYALDNSVRIVGPYSGLLDNSGDHVELASPQAPDTNGFAYVLQDKVDYKPEWNLSALGLGASLQRLVLGDFGNDPTNWTAAAPSPGQARGSGGPPAITAQPRGGLFVENSSFSVNVGASGTPPLVYQWLLNDTPIPGATAATLTITNAQLSASGTYSVLIYNGGGSVASTGAVITIRSLPRITTQPLSQTNAPGTNSTFTVGVNGTAPITYQWRFNGTDIPGATGGSLIVSNLDLYANCGFYDVAVHDAVGSVTSQVAVLNASIKPVITNAPVSVSVVQGGTAVFRVIAGPIHPLLPIAYRWVNTGGTPPVNTNSVFIVTNVQIGGSIRINVSNPAGQVNITSGIALTVLPDFDHDGIADAWEVLHGFNTNDVTDALIDSDGDGMSNRDEYLAGTDPLDPASVLRVNFAETNSSILQFTAQSNVSYTIQYRTNLTDAPWRTWTNVVPESSVRNLPFRVEQRDLRFYRVVTPIQLE